MPRLHLSITVLPTKIKIYKLSHPIHSCNIMCQTNIRLPDPEITVYKYRGDDDNLFEEQSLIFDPREYTIFNIHEDIPGIDHVGIVHYISGMFMDAEIPLLYVNTYGYNLILISDEYVDIAQKLLEKIK
jgi:hypothetical protein